MRTPATLLAPTDADRRLQHRTPQQPHHCNDGMASMAPAAEQPAATPQQPMNTATGDGLYAIIKTSMGTIKAKLEMHLAP
jgi:hypothetical protein